MLETKKNAINDVLNSIVDSVYVKSTGTQKFSKNKIIVIYDSLTFSRSNEIIIKSEYKKIKKLTFDSIFSNSSYKIDLKAVQKKADFKYKYSLKLKRGVFPNSFRNSNYALKGFLIFSDICIDDTQKYCALNCTYTNGDFSSAKYYLIFIKKTDEKWKIDKISLQNICF